MSPSPVAQAVAQSPNRPVPVAVDELHYLIRAQYKLLYVVSAEEERVERWLGELATLESKPLRERWDVTAWQARQLIHWSCSQGFRCASMDVPGDVRDPIRALDWIANNLQRDAIVVLRDFHPFLNDPMVARRVRDLPHLFADGTAKRSVVFLSPVVKIPAEMEKDLVVVDFDLPDRQTLEDIVRDQAFAGAASQRFGKNFQKVLESPELQREIAEAALGLAVALEGGGLAVGGSRALLGGEGGPAGGALRGGGGSRRRSRGRRRAPCTAVAGGSGSGSSAGGSRLGDDRLRERVDSRHGSSSDLARPVHSHRLGRIHRREGRASTQDIGVVVE